MARRVISVDRGRSDVGPVRRQIGRRMWGSAFAGRRRAGEAERVGGHRQRAVGVAVDEHFGVRGLGRAGQAGQVERRG